MNTARMPRKTSTRGFTLIELMIALLVIAILAAVAIPSYQEHLVKGRRAAVQAFMMDVASKEKQYLLDARAYTTDLSALGATVPSEVSSYYAVTVATTATPPAFTISAVPATGTPQASDGTLTLTSDGLKSPSGKW